jgi:2-keto-4-pentenoate hydratase/2-oxohepta-3-ene-1,7-dioic acid hydratase in catechol pathway
VGENMKLLTFKAENSFRLGVKVEQGIIDVFKAAQLFGVQGIPETVDEVLLAGDTAFSTLASLVQQVQNDWVHECILAEEEITFGPCLLKPSKIICVGLNYRKHAEESNMPIPEYPILFNKFPNTIAAHGEVVPLPFNSKEVDYEAELGIVIGKRAKRVSTEEALEYVSGYCNVNDLSARDLQFRTQQWLLGKSLDGFSPVGPYLVTSDEVGDPNDLSIRCIVNGEVRQDSNTKDMIFNCAELVSYISEHMTLEPGDLILTGTPAGVVFGYPKEKQVWLHDGDEVTIEIEKLGQLTNRMKQEV